MKKSESCEQDVRERRINIASVPGPHPNVGIARSQPGGAGATCRRGGSRGRRCHQRRAPCHSWLGPQDSSFYGLAHFLNLGRLGCCFLVQGCFTLSLFCSLSRARQVWLSNSHRSQWPHLVTMFLCPRFPRCPPVLSVAPRLRSPGAPSSAALPRCCAVLRGDATVLVPPSPGRPTGAFVCSLLGAPGVGDARSSRST